VGIGNRFEHFLSPVIQKVSTAEMQSAEHNPAAIASEGATEETTGEPHTTPINESEEGSAHEKELEWTLMGISILAAFGGWGLAWVFYIKRPDLPDRVTATLGGVYTTVLNKYYVDEIYRAVVVSPLVTGSTKVLWRGIDTGVIDATVNEAGHGAQEISDGVRRQQSGNIRSYAGWVAAGAALVIIYMVWMGTK